MTDAQRRAFSRAVAANAAATVCDLGGGSFMVPSQSSRDVYMLWTGPDGELHCPCEAGQRDYPCIHRAAVALFITQVTALEQSRALKPRFPARKEVELL